MAKKALGKGLGALIKPAPVKATGAESISTGDGEMVQYLPISSILPSPHNPRKEFSKEEISELADSIKQHGIIQPLIVREVSGNYELIAGERRWRASQSIPLKTVPAIVREASDRDVIEMALIENLQRQDLNPIEEAAGYLQLVKEFSLKQEEIAKRVGKSRASVANAMRLLDLGEEIQAFLVKGQLSVGHAKVILGIKDQDNQFTVADQVIRHKLTVRATEKAVHDLNNPSPAQTRLLNPKQASPTDPELKKIENTLRDKYATHVKVVDNGKKGKIELEFYGADDFQRLLDLLGLDDY